jgi:hypothetical protein
MFRFIPKILSGSKSGSESMFSKADTDSDIDVHLQLSRKWDEFTTMAITDDSGVNSPFPAVRGPGGHGCQ